jgi:import inner membrane translocase subunit TIM44
METKTAKTVASGIHQIKKDVVGTRHAYFAEYRPKEVRDKEREELLKSKQPQVSKNQFGLPQVEGPVAANEEDTGIVMHRQSKLSAAWDKFKTESKIGQALHSYSRNMEESDNPVLRMWRNWKENSVSSEPETVKVIKAFRTVEPLFEQNEFLKELANFMIPDILDAYLTANVADMQAWTTEGVII